MYNKYMRIICNFVRSKGMITFRLSEARMAEAVAAADTAKIAFRRAAADDHRCVTAFSGGQFDDGGGGGGKTEPRNSRGAPPTTETRLIFSGKPTERWVGEGHEIATARVSHTHTHTDYISTTSAHDTTGSGAFRFAFASSPRHGACETVGESHSSKSREPWMWAPMQRRCGQPRGERPPVPVYARTCSHTRATG